MQNRIQIDIAAIPDFRRIELAKGALVLTEQVFAMPGAEERYQAWLSERNRKNDGLHCEWPRCAPAGRTACQAG